MIASLRECFVSRKFLSTLFVLVLISIETMNVFADAVPPANIGASANQWTSRVSATDNNWTSIAYGNGIFVAVANTGTGNRVMTSPDGITWTSRTSAANNAWTSVTYGNGLFVAVTCGTSSASCGLLAGGRIMTSPDGITWTTRTAPVDNLWNSVTYGNGLFVAVAPYAASYGNSQLVITSSDGITWTARTVPANESWSSVTYGNGKFVAVNSYQYGAYHFMYSSDGITWTTSGPTYDYYSWNSVTYGNGLFVAVSNTSRVMTSPDGITWTSRTGTPNSDWRSVTFGNGLFVAVSSSGTGSRVMTSRDGITWTSRTSATDNNWQSVAYGNGLFVAVANSGTGNRVMTSEPETSVSLENAQITINYITPPDSDLHSMIVLRSASAVVATPATGVTYNVGDVIGASTVACVDSSVATSTADSCTATGLSNGTAYHLKLFAKDTSGNYSSGIVPAGSPATPNPVTTITTGTDPSNASIIPGGSAVMADAFTFQTSAGSYNIPSVVVNLGSVANASGTSLVEITSDNGVTVYGSTANPANATTSVTLTGLNVTTTPAQYKIRITPKSHANMPAVPGNTYTLNAKIDSWSATNPVAGSDTGSTTITIDNQSPTLMSNDGSVWTSRQSVADNYWQGIAYGGGTFVAVAWTGTGNRIMTSPDGITWTVQNSTGLDDQWQSVAYGTVNGTTKLFVAVSYDGTVMTSPNGITWTRRTAASNSSWTSVTYKPSSLTSGVFVAVAAVGASYRVMYSGDGVNWTGANAAAANQWQSVTYGNGMFVAVANNGTSTRIMTSPDAITWTARPGAGDYDYSSVTYGNGLFVAVSQNDGDTTRAMTSPDGINWTLRTTPNNYWKAITYGNGLFVATANFGTGNRVMTSPDGITWTQRTSAADNLWYGVGYGNGVFVAVGASGTGNRIMTSGVMTVSATPGDAQFTVNYTVPNDPDIDSILVIRSDQYTNNARPAEGSTYAVGDTISIATIACIDTNVSPGTTSSCTATSSITNGNTYYVRVVAKDVYGNYSEDFDAFGSPVAVSAFTTLGDGTDPSNAVVVPGGSAVAADAFTLQTSKTTKTVSAVTVNFGSAENAKGLSLVEITSDNGATVYGSVANPTTATVSISGLGISVTGTPVQYKIRITPKTHANMPAVPGRFYMINAKIDSFTGGENAHVLSDVGGTAVTIDNQSPMPTGADASAWTARTSAADNTWSSVAYSEGVGVFAAVSSSGASNRVMTSPDGTTWTSRASAADNNWQAIAYGNQTFVAVSNSGTSTRVMTSQDGITWTLRTSAADNAWSDIAYGNGTFVAISTDGASRAMTSPDGISWTLSTTPDKGWKAITYGNGLFVAVAQSGTSNRVMTSPDGVTWTLRTSAADNTWSDIAYGNDLFVAVSSSGTGNRVMTSPDGINWTLRTSAADNGWASVTYGNGLFIAVANTGTGNRVMTSPDGINWTLQLSAADNGWASITYANGLFIAVANTGTGNRVMTAGTAQPTLIPGNTQVTISYTTPGDNDLSSIIILRSTSPVVAVPVEGTTYTLGNVIGAATVACVDSSVATSTADSCTATGLSNGQPYYFKLFTKDSTGNYSAGSVPVGSYATPNPVTTITTGTDPSNATVAPGSSAVMADAFTFQTSAGSYNIPSVVVNLGSATNASGTSLVEITSDNGATVYGSTANPANATTSITLTGLNATTTLAQYRIRITPKTHANMPVVPGGAYAINAKIDSWSATNPVAGTDTGSTTITVDNQSPADATSTSAVPGDTQATISYTTPADGDLHSVIVLRSTSAVADIPVEGATYIAGNTIGGATVACVDTTVAVSSLDSCTATGLSNGTSYHFKIFAKDSSGNYSLGIVPTGSPVGINPVITLTTGTDPGSTNVAPGGSAVMAGAFTLQMTSGTSIASSTVINLGSVAAAAGVALIEIVSDDGGTVYGTSTASANATTSVTLTGLNATTTLAQYKIRITPKSHAAMPAVPGDVYTINAKVESLTGGSAQVGSDTAGTSIIIDNQSPIIALSDVSNWSTRSSVGASWTSITYGEGIFVAMASGDIITSADGITWTNSGAIPTAAWTSVAYGSGTFVAVACGAVSSSCNSTASTRIASSLNGTNWTSRTSPSTNQWQSVTYGNGLFVAVSNNGTGNRVMTSPDGTTWTSRTSAADYNWTSITYGNGLFVAVANSGTANRVMTSPDGITWTLRTSAADNAWESVTYGNGLFVAVSTDGGTSHVMTSPDGITWTLRTSAADNSWQAATYGNGLFVAVAYSGTGNRIMTSPDGINWTSQASATDSSWQSVAYGNGFFAAVANAGNPRVMVTTFPQVNLTRGNTQITVNYTPSDDEDISGVVVLRSTSAITNVPAEGVTYAAGNTIGGATVACVDAVIATSTPDSCTATGLSNGLNYNFKVFVKDSSGNYSNYGITPVGSPARPNPNLTLGDGIDPASAALLPGSSAVAADAFTFQTQSGSNAVTAIVVDLGSVSAASSIALIEITSDNGATVYGSSTNPTNATTSITLTGLTATVTPTQYKIRITPKTHASMPAVPGDIYTITAKVDSWTASYVPVGSDTAGATFTIDNQSPSDPTGDTLIPEYSQITVPYTTGTDSDLHSIIVLYATSTVTDVPAEGVTYQAGNTIGTSTVACVNAAPPSTSSSCVITGLTNGVSYYVKIFARDITGNYSSGIVPGGFISPGTVTLIGTGSDPSNATIAPGGSATPAGAFTLRTSSGSDTITSIIVNLGSVLAASSTSRVEITSDNGATVYGSSTNPTNATTSITLTGLTATVTPTQYKIRITPKTHASMPAVPGDIYTITAKVDSWTGSNSASGSDTAGTVISIDNQSPAAAAMDIVTVTRTSAADNDWQSIVYGNGVFVAVAGTGSGNRVMTSPDGITWTSRTSAANNYWRSVTYGNGLFVAVSFDGGANHVMTSPDGITWTLRVSAADNMWMGVTYGNSLFVAVAQTGVGNRVMTSPDGITWTLRTSAVDNQWVSVTYGNGLFVAVANTGTGDRVMTSPDGVTWTSRMSAADNGWSSVTYGNSLFVAVANSGASNRVMTSPDGITWTLRANPNNGWNSVTYGNGLFIAVAYDFAVMASPDGIIWISQMSAANNNWNAVAYGNGIFVTVAYSGTGNRVMTPAHKAVAVPGDTQAILSYTASSDVDLQSIVVLRSSNPITDVPVDGTTYSAGNVIGGSTVACIDSTITASSTGYCTSTGLVNGSSYHFKLFAKDTNGNYSTGIIPSGSPVIATTTAAVSQSAYQFFASSTVSTPGASLAGLNTAATLINTGDAFRMRMTFHAAAPGLATNGKLFKLQYAQKSGACDAGFVGETYSDITNSTPISYYDTLELTNNTLLGTQSDVTHGADTIVNETYVESNPFINSQATIPSGQDGKFDFSLYENGAPSNTSYCIRAVNINGSALNSYTVIPEIATAAQQVRLASYRLRKDDGNDTSATYQSTENGQIATTYVAGDRVRIRFTVENIGSGTTKKSYQLEYATSSCTVWTQVPRTVDVISHHWRTEPSMYIPDNGGTSHSAGLSTPNGKSFAPGRTQTFNNVTQPITLRSNEYTEIEYSIRSTTKVSPDIPYCFRLSAVGDASVFTYPVTPQLTPAKRILRYQAGGGGGGSRNTIISADNSTSTATTTVTGGGVAGGAASSTESTATTTTQQSTTTPSTGGGGGDVGYLFGSSSFAYGPEDNSEGMVLGDFAEGMCVDMVSHMLFGSEDNMTQGEVSQLQYFLKTRGYFNAVITGYFGRITAAAVKDFQRDNNLSPSGIVGRVTRERMRGVGCLNAQAVGQTGYSSGFIKAALSTFPFAN